jgi:hypothetical protein
MKRGWKNAGRKKREQQADLWELADVQGRGHTDCFGLLEGGEGDGLAHEDGHVLNAVELHEEVAL